MQFLLFISAIFLFIVKIPEIDCTSDAPPLTYETMYNDAVDFYLDEDWGHCVRYFESALEDYHWWRKNIVRCRKECYQEAENSDRIFPDDFKYDTIFERIIINTLCLVKCKKTTLDKRAEVVASFDIDKAFEIRKPYDYLQLCYFKMGQLEDAANAAATVLAVQPEHEVMQTNLKYYINMGGLDINDIVNLELQEFAKKYMKGDSAYTQEDFEATITHMERSLTLFLEELEGCRLLCENPFNQGWHPDFISSIANHYTFTLRCKMKCIDKLSNLYGEKIENFVASYFNYLQFSYFKVGNLAKACEAVESFLILVPDDSVQLRNKQFFWSMQGVKEEFFTPRKEVVDLKERSEMENKLMDYIEVNFISLKEDDDTPTFSEDQQPSEDLGRQKSNPAKERPSAKARAVNYLKQIAEKNINILAGDEELKGPNRVMAEGFLSQPECQILANLAQQGSVEGDGYHHRVSPHTPSERFEGVTLTRAALLVNAGLLEPAILEMLIRTSELSMGFIERHFSLSEPLYFSFTHLVCRSPKTASLNRSITDLSHSIHVDNCILQPTGDCLKIPPAYTFRDYSAILYLTGGEDVDGGEFIFSDDTKGIKYQSAVSPKCGRLVGFSAGMENPHGVRPVLKGRRCALAMWYTFNKKYREVERTLAEELLMKIKSGEIKPENPD